MQPYISTYTLGDGLAELARRTLDMAPIYKQLALGIVPIVARLVPDIAPVATASKLAQTIPVMCYAYVKGHMHEQSQTHVWLLCLEFGCVFSRASVRIVFVKKH